jgi:hypothetical protein
MFRHSRGQVGVIYAAVLPVLICAMALGTDVAVMYCNWVQMQKAADAGALAGANYLPFDTSTAKSTATTFAESDGIKAAEITGTVVSADNLSITVNLSRTVPYYMARALGLVSSVVSVSGTAGIQQNGAGGRGLMPIALNCPNADCSSYEAGTTYQMKQSQVGPGNWAALALGGSGASVYRQNIMTGYTGPMASSEWTETGNIVGPTGQGISDRITKGVEVDPSIAAGSAPAGPAPSYDPRLVVVPFINFGAPGTKGNGKTLVPIVGYAQMWLLGTSNNNNTVDAVYLGPVSNSGSTTISSFGLFTPVLLR